MKLHHHLNLNRQIFIIRVFLYVRLSQQPNFSFISWTSTISPTHTRPCIFLSHHRKKLLADQEFAHAKSIFIYMVVLFCFLIPQFFFLSATPFRLSSPTITLFLFPKSSASFRFLCFFSNRMPPTPTILIWHLQSTNFSSIYCAEVRADDSSCDYF